ncbi:MAG: hypothetical protein FVQ81_02565 [Candidatus Glassbacteria bacterium]|nr:hypothetical protein [Candidatus Glassbacteria bacterium]
MLFHSSMLKITLVLCLSALPAPAKTIYLSAGGDDNSACGAGAEFATLEAALGCLDAGDTLFVREGEYTGGPLVELDGTAEAPIVLMGESLNAVIDTSNRDNRDNLRLDHSSHVIVDGLTFRRSSRAGLSLIRCDHITVRNCVFANNYKWGLFTGFADDVLFENNESYGARDEHGIYHSNSGNRFIIRGNHVHHNRGNGIHLNGDPELMSEPGDDGVLNFGIVERNIIHDNGAGGGAGINMTHVQDIICRNNLIYNNFAGGFTYYADTDDQRYTSRRALIMHNTVHFKSGGRAVINIQSTSKSTVIVNNILVSGGFEPVLQMWSDYSSTMISDYNLFWGIDSSNNIVTTSDRLGYSLGNWRSNSGNDKHTRYADPSFVSVPDTSFVPSDTSAAVDAAAPMDTVRAMVASLDSAGWLLGRLDSIRIEDINENLRPAGDGPDIGAFEVGAGPESLYDFNNDGRFNVADALSLLLKGLRNPGEESYDIDDDGVWSIGDVIALLRIMMENSSLLAANDDAYSL